MVSVVGMSHPTNQTVQFASVSLGLGSALRRSLEELAKFHDGKPGPWLDELESGFIENVKRSHSEGLSMEDEVKAANAAIAFIKFWVDTARKSITNSSAR